MPKIAHEHSYILWVFHLFMDLSKYQSNKIDYEILPLLIHIFWFVTSKYSLYVVQLDSGKLHTHYSKFIICYVSLFGYHLTAFLYLFFPSNLSHWNCSKTYCFVLCCICCEGCKTVLHSLMETLHLLPLRKNKFYSVLKITEPFVNIIDLFIEIDHNFLQ